MKTRSSGHYIPTLDGLRAVAILLVIASHTVSHVDHPRIAILGHVGVLIFFALSGYLITTRLVQEFDTHGRISLRNFYVRRVFRILPPSIFYLGVIWILWRVGLVVCSGEAIRSALLLYLNYADLGDAGWRVAHFWSLAVEEHFYLFWPALLIGFGVRKGWRTAATLAAIVIVWRVIDDRFLIVSRLFHAPNLVDNSGRTDLIADALFWGCCLAFVLRTSWISLGKLQSTVIAVAAFCSILAIVFFQLPHAYIPLYLAPSVMLGAIVANPLAPLGRFLELPPLRYIGKLSYSLYIWQQLFVSQAHIPLALALAAIAGCALISYYCIEQPCIRFGRRFTHKVAPPAKPSNVMASTINA